MHKTSRVSGFILFSQGTGIAAAVIGGVVLIGWWQNIGVLKSILPNLVSMKANTALSFLATGAALFLMNARSSTNVQRRLGRLVAAGVTTLTSLTLVEYFGALDLGIDQLLFIDDTLATATSHPGRMAPVTAVALTLSGAALLLMDWNLLISRRLAMVVLLLAMLGLAGYIFGAPSLYQVRAYTSIAVHTAVTLILLSLGIIVARPTKGFMKTIVSETSGGLMARRLLLLIPLLLLALGWVAFQGQNVGFYDDRFALAIVIVFGMVITSMITMGVARLLYLLDIKRQQAQKQLVALNANLEHAIAERTCDLESANRNLAAEIVERKRAEEEVRHLSLTDELTGLLNRRGFLLLAEQELKRARRANAVHALIYIDLDGLKFVNDTYGHKAGDAMLKDAACVLKAISRDSDIVARLGGDEFAILAVNAEQSEVIFARIRVSLAQFDKGSDSSYPLSFSTGVLRCLPTDQKTLLELLVDADALMYKQKQERRLKR